MRKLQFENLGVNRFIFAICAEDSHCFKSKNVADVFLNNKTFSSLDEMEEKLIAPLNAEFGSEFYKTRVTESYLYLRCKVIGCRFSHGYTYSGEGTISSIESCPKVSVIHKHNIVAHDDHKAIIEEHFTFKSTSPC